MAKRKRKWLWLRLGDAGDYKRYDDIDDLADDLEEYGVIGPFWKHERYYGVTNPQFSSLNYISLFWGDEEAQPTKEIGSKVVNYLNKRLTSKETNPTATRKYRKRRRPLKEFERVVVNENVPDNRAHLIGARGKVVGTWDRGYYVQFDEPKGIRMEEQAYLRRELTPEEEWP